MLVLIQTAYVELVFYITIDYVWWYWKNEFYIVALQQNTNIYTFHTFFFFCSFLFNTLLFVCMYTYIHMCKYI